MPRVGRVGAENLFRNSDIVDGKTNQGQKTDGPMEEGNWAAKILSKIM